MTEHMSHQVHLFDGEGMARDFMRDIAIRLDRLESQGMTPLAVALREDLWPELTNWNGYPVVRLAANSPVMWGVIA